MSQYEASYPEFVVALASLASNVESADETTRQAAVLYLKNTIVSPTAAQLNMKHDRWKLLESPIRKQVKDLLTQALQQNDAIAQQAASTVSHVAAVELPYKEWPELVPLLHQWVTNSGPEAVGLIRTALQCLGYVAEAVATSQELIDVPDLEETVVNSMLTAIVTGCSHADLSCRRSGLTALRNALPFVSANMERVNECNVIIEKMCEGASSQDAGMRALAYQSLSDTCEQYYEKLTGEHVRAFYELTIGTLTQAEEEHEVKMAAIELWTTLAFTEALLQDAQAPCQKYVETAMPNLVPRLLDTLLQQDEDGDEEDWNLRAAGAVCLEHVSQTVGSPVLAIVIPFVTANITGPEWRKKDASNVAFGCVLDGPATDDLAKYIMDAIPILVGLFDDQHNMVRDSAVHCIGKIFLLHMNVLEQRQAAQMVHQVLHGLMRKLRDTPRVAAHSSTALFNLSQSLRQEEVPESGVLSEPMLPLLQELMNAAERADADEQNLRTSALTAAAELVNVGPSDTERYLLELLPAVLGKLEAGLTNAANQDLLGGLVNITTALIARTEISKLEPYCDRLVQALLQCFSTVPILSEELLFAIGNLAGKLDHNFTKYVPAVMEHVQASVANFEARGLCAAGVGVVVDLAGAVAGQIQPYCDDLMQVLLALLKDSLVDRELKTAAFSCFGDIAMAVGAGFLPYLDKTLMMILQASHSPMPNPEDGDDDAVAYISTLRRSLFEAYSGIILGVKDGNIQDSFLATVPNILSLLDYIQHANQQPLYDDVCVQAVTTLGDLAQSLGTYELVRNCIKQHQAVCMPLLQKCHTLDKDTAEWAMSHVQTIWQG